MIGTRQLLQIACLSALASGSLVGCAASAIGDPELDTETDNSLANENPGQDAGAAEEDEEDPPPTAKPDATVRKDASAPTETDSGTPKDAGATKDAGQPVVDAGPKDAGAPKDAGQPVVDAGPKDAGQTVADAGKPADPPPSNNNQCSKDSDCNNVCIAVGILPCCNAVKVCGCTWAPGAYCL